jgi:hypothetical protein
MNWFIGAGAVILEYSGMVGGPRLRQGYLKGEWGTIDRISKGLETDAER